VARRPATRLKAIPTSPFLVTLAYPYGPAGPSTPASDAGVTRERLIVLREKRPWVHVRGHGLLLVLAVLVVVLMLAPASVGVTAAASGVPGSAASNSPVALPTAATTSPLGSASTSSGIPGQDPANEPSINPVALAQEQAARPGYQTLLADTHNGTLTPPPVTSPAAPHPPVSGAAGRYAGIDYGWITGTVVSSKPPYTPISGAVVSAEPVAGFCPSVGCINVQSGATGAFTVAASIGENEVLVSDASYMTNRTWAYVSTDGYSNVGTIELVEDGFVSGILLGSDPAHEPVSGINVSSLSRDGSVFGSPTDYTNGQGRFTVAVPPLPSEITFTPVFPFTPYQPNTTFVNVSSGQSISIGTVYLQRMTEVQVTLVDSTNGLPLDGVLGAIQVCSRATGFCPVQGTRGGGPVEYAQAPVGPDVIHAYMNGYVLNSTALGVVPSVRPGGPAVNMGTVAVVPTGGIQLWVNITGISTPYGNSPPTSIWPVGEFATVSSCNLDGLSASGPTLYNMTSSECTSACVSPGTGNVIEGIPLRNFITVAPDEIGCIQPGYPTWPIPEDMPVFDNWGWVNVTPDKLVNAGGIDLLPGSYIEGEVLPASETGWDVTACSTDEPALCGEGSFADSQYADSYTFGVPNNCPEYPTPAASYTYCVAAPPGPVELRVTASNASANYTWAYNPPLSWPSQPLLLADADQDNSPVINLTLANVVGRVLQSRSLTPVLGLPSIQVCPAGISPSAVVCGAGVANSTGFFSVNAPPGWDEVTVSAPLYEPNSTWVYVTRDNSTGTILLNPYGFVNGRVVDSSLNGVYEATVQLCPVSAPNSCKPVGADGLTATDGSYYGATPAGPLPNGAYVVEASAPGLTTDFTWVNITTPGENFTAPTIVLDSSVAVPPGAGPRQAASGPTGGSSAGAWVIGSVVDARYGIGLPSASITATPLNGGTNVIISSIRGSGGEFNDSLPSGDYTISFGEQGYYYASQFLNVSGNSSVVNIGTVALVPFPTVTGRIVIDPASWRSGVTEALGLGPGQGAVELCSNDASSCGPAALVGTGGNFNGSAPAGTYDLVLATGTGTGPGTAPGGFVQNRSEVNVTNESASIALPAVLGLSVYGIITGSIINSNATSSATLPVREDQITADSTFPVDETQGEILTADGTYAIIFPESNGLNLTAGGLGSWIPAGIGITVNGTSQGGKGNYTLPAGATIALKPIALEHFGYIDAKVTDESDLRNIPYATVSASEVGTLWSLPTTFTATGVANGGGFINLSAPPSIPALQPRVALSISAPDYTVANRTVTVNASRTTYVNGSSYQRLDGVLLLPWGWITGQVSDTLTGRLLSSVSVTVSVGGAQAGRPGITTNGLGLYRVDAPPSPTDMVSLALGGYSANRSSYNVSFGEDVAAPPIHLIGDGIVGGRVIAYPALNPVAGATVSVCPVAQPNCVTSVTTNASGDFWIAAPPGLSIISVSVAGYVTNSSGFVVVRSDAWVWGGVVTVQQYAHVSGTVVGLPGGLPLSGAFASLCAPSSTGIGAGPCFGTVVTEPDGSFYLQAPAGSYVLDADALGYNDSYLPVSLLPGETLPVGLIFVQEFGTATGAVYGADTDQAAPGATVVACEEWGADVCDGPVATQGGGVYVISDAAGPHVFEADAPGYQSSFQSVTLTPGTTVNVPTFLLVPIGSNGRFDVSGRVTAGAVTGPAIPGAVVTATGGSSVPVDANGDFTISLAWGNYTIAASDPGYLTQARTVEVTGPLSGVDFYLSVTTFTVSGLVQNGLTGAPVAGVAIDQNGVALGHSTIDGMYSVALPNGTANLVAVGPAGYAPVPFAVAVSGAALVHPLTLFPPEVSVNGLVVNGLTGLPLASASITITGTTAEGTAWSANVVSDADGRFVVMAYPGAYTAVAQSGGYASAQSSVVVNATSSYPLTLSLQPMSSGGGSSAPASAVLWVVVGGIGAVAVAAVAIVATRRPSRPQANARIVDPDVTKEP
jgi:Carboxypeptidase regulatory-like domain